MVQPHVYRRDELAGTDPRGRRHEAVWVSLDDLATGDIPLSPAGLLELLVHRTPPIRRVPGITSS